MDFKTRKNINAILFFINKSDGEIDKLILMKLLWLSDRIHLAKYGRQILKDTYNALPLGMIPSNTMDLAKKSIPNFFDVNDKSKNVKTLSSLNKYDNNIFSESDIEVMNLIWEEYKTYEASEISEYSHEFAEWIQHEKSLADKKQPSSFPVNTEDLFLESSSQHYNEFIKTLDINIEATKSIFNFNKNINSLLTA